MADARFFRRHGPFTLGAIAVQVGGAVRQPQHAALQISDIAPLATAEQNELSFLYASSFADAAGRSRAGAVVTDTSLARKAQLAAAVLIVADAKLAYAIISDMFYPPVVADAHIDANAYIDPSARIGPGCRIDAGSVIGPRAEIDADCHIAPNAVVGPGVVVGENTRIGANSTITNTLIGNHVVIASGASIGGAGFGFVASPAGPRRTPQLGRVIIGDGVEIGANCTIDRGAAEDTIIGAGSVLDNQVHVAHGVTIGRCCVIAGQVGIAGSASIGDGVMIGGQAGISDHIVVGSYARIAGGCGVIRDVAAREVVGGYPALPIRQWHRQTIIMSQLARGERRRNVRSN